MNAPVAHPAPTPTEEETRWPRRLLALGIVLAVGVQVTAWGVNLGACAGGLLVAWSCWKLRLRGVTWLALGWLALEGAEGYLPEHTALDLLGSAIGLGGFLWLCRAGAERAGLTSARGSRAWKHAFWAGTVCWGGMLLVGTGVATVQALRGADPWVSHSLALLIAVALVSAFPAVLFVRAGALEVVDRPGAQPGRVSRLLTRRSGAVLLMGLLLTPIWLMLPSWVHFLRTPTFDAYVATAQGEPDLPPLPDYLKPTSQPSEATPAWGKGQAVQTDEEVEGQRTFGYGYTLELNHGEQRLLTLQQRLLRAEAWPGGELLGVQWHTVHAGHDPRFRLAVRYAVGEGFLSSAPASGERRVPVRIDVVLATAAQPEPWSSELAWVEQVGEPPLPSFLRGAKPGLSWSSLLVPPGPPPTEEGLRYTATLEGSFVLRRDGSTDAWLDAELGANNDEYSYRFKLVEETVNQDAGRMVHTRTSKQSRSRSWNGEVW